MQCHSSAASHVGLVREVNEDHYLCRDDVGLWAVADGMGGHQAGELASRAITRHLQQVPACSQLSQMVDMARQAIEGANRELTSMESQFGLARVPGSTVALLLVHGREGAVAWVGDSRVYRLRDSNAEQVTRDHSHVQELIDEGVISADETETHPMAHVITRAVGIDPDVRIECIHLEVQPGDRFLVCSDGLSRLLPLAEIAQDLATEDLEQSVKRMLDKALKRGAPDNVTLIAVSCAE